MADFKYPRPYNEVIAEYNQTPMGNPVSFMPAAQARKYQAMLGTVDWEQFTGEMAENNKRAYSMQATAIRNNAVIPERDKDDAANVMAYATYDRHQNPQHYDDIERATREFGIANPMASKEQVEEYRFGLWKKAYGDTIDAYGALPKHVLEGMSDISAIDPHTFEKLASIYCASQERKGNYGFASGWNSDEYIADLDYQLEAGAITPEKYNKLKLLTQRATSGFWFDVGAGIHSFYGAMEENVWQIGTGAVAGAAVGAFAGGIGSIPMAIAGAVAGLKAGAVAGSIGATLTDSYTRTHAQIVGEVMNENPYLSEDLVRASAMPYAFGVSALDAIGVVLGLGLSTKAGVRFADRYAVGKIASTIGSKVASSKFGSAVGSTLGKTKAGKYAAQASAKAGQYLRGETSSILTFALRPYLGMIIEEGVTEGLQGVIQELANQNLLTDRDLLEESATQKKEKAKTNIKQAQDQGQLRQLLGDDIVSALGNMLGAQRNEGERRMDRADLDREDTSYVDMFTDNMIMGMEVASVMGLIGTAHGVRDFYRTRQQLNDSVAKAGVIAEQAATLRAGLDTEGAKASRTTFNKAFANSPLHFSAREIQEDIVNSLRTDPNKTETFRQMQDMIVNRYPQFSNLAEMAQQDADIEIGWGDWTADFYDTDVGRELYKYAKLSQDDVSVYGAAKEARTTGSLDSLKQSIKTEGERIRSENEVYDRLRKTLRNDIAEFKAQADTRPELYKWATQLAHMADPYPDKSDIDKIAREVRKRMRAGGVMDEDIINGIARIQQSVYETFTDIIGESDISVDSHIANDMFKVLNASMDLRSQDAFEGGWHVLGDEHPTTGVIRMFRPFDSPEKTFVHEYGHYMQYLIQTLHDRINDANYMMKHLKPREGEDLGTYDPEAKTQSITPDMRKRLMEISTAFNKKFHWGWLVRNFGFKEYPIRKESDYITNRVLISNFNAEKFVDSWLHYIVNGGFEDLDNPIFEAFRKGLIRSFVRWNKSSIAWYKSGYVREVNGKLVRDNENKYDWKGWDPVAQSIQIFGDNPAFKERIEQEKREYRHPTDIEAIAMQVWSSWGNRVGEHDGGVLRPKDDRQFGKIMNALIKTDSTMEDIYEGLDLRDIADSVRTMIQNNPRSFDPAMLEKIRKLVGDIDSKGRVRTEGAQQRNEKQLRKILDAVNVMAHSPETYKALGRKQGGDVDTLTLDKLLEKFAGTKPNTRLYNAVHQYFRFAEKEAEAELVRWKTPEHTDKYHTYTLIKTVNDAFGELYLDRNEFKRFVGIQPTEVQDQWRALGYLSGYMARGKHQHGVSMEEFAERMGVGDLNDLLPMLQVYGKLGLSHKEVRDAFFKAKEKGDNGITEALIDRGIRNGLILPQIVGDYPFSGKVDKAIANMMTHTKEASELVALIDRSLGLNSRKVRKQITMQAESMIVSMRLSDLSSPRIKKRIKEAQKNYLATLRTGDIMACREALYQTAVWREVLAQAIQYRSAIGGAFNKATKPFMSKGKRTSVASKTKRYNSDVWEIGKYLTYRMRGSGVSQMRSKVKLEQIERLNPDLAEAVRDVLNVEGSDMNIGRMTCGQINRMIVLLQRIAEEAKELQKASLDADRMEMAITMRDMAEQIAAGKFKQHIVQTRKDSGKTFKYYDKKEKKEVEKEIVTETGHDLRKWYDLGKLGETWGIFWRHYIARPMHFFNALDNGVSTGVFNRVMVRPIHEAIARTNYNNRELSKAIESLLKSDAVKSKFNKDSQIVINDFLDVNGNNSYTLGASGEYYRRGYKELFVMLLNMGNVGNLKRLNEKFAPKMGFIEFQDRCQKMMKRLVKEGIIDKPFMDAVQATWDIFERAGQMAQAAHHAVYGDLMNMVDKIEIDLKFSEKEGFGRDSGITEYKGGYVPIVYDRETSAVRNEPPEKFSMDGITQNLMGGMESATTNMYGFTKDRRERAPSGQKLDFNLERILNEIYKINTFAQMMPVCMRMHRLLNATDKSGTSIRSMLDTYFPHVYEDMIEPYMMRAVANTTRYGGQRTAMTRLLDAFQGALGRSIMFGNVVNTIQQVTQIFPAMAYVKPVYLVQAFQEYVGGSMNHTQFMDGIRRKSTYMATRLDYRTTEYENFGRMVNDNQFTTSIKAAVDAGATNAKHYFNVARDFSQKYSYGLQACLQHQIDAIVWLGAYNEAKMSMNMTEEEAVYHADSRVAMSQTGFTATDVSNFESSNNAVSRMLGMFYSFFNNQLNMHVYQLTTLWRTHKSLHGFLFYATLNHMLTLALPFILSEVITQGLSGNGVFKQDDEEYWDYMKRMVVVPWGHGMLTTLPTGGLFTGTFDKMMGVDNYFSTRFQVNMPVLSTATQIANSMSTAYRDLMDGNEFHRNVVRDVARASSLVLRISPLDLVGREINWIYELNRGNIHESSAWQIFRLMLTTRVSEDERK